MKRERGSTSYGGASLLRVRLRRLFRVDVCKERGLLLLTLHYYLRARALVESRPVRPERKASSSSSVLAPYTPCVSLLLFNANETPNIF